MTEIDFYILAAESSEARLTVACRIADKAVQRDQHVFIRPSTAGEAKLLDELLWTFSQGSFLPHRIVTAAGAGGPPPLEPVLIGVDTEPVVERWDLLINLSADVPEYFSRYARVAEVVDAEAGRRERGRERYRYYRDRGYTLNTHNV